MEAYKKGIFSSCPEEVCAILDGTVPKDITGTYFRNGGGVFEVGSERQPVLHPFDTDGMVLAAQFKDGKVHFRNRIVNTKGFKTERQAKRVMFRGSFGTQRPGGFWGNAFDLNIKNVANTNVIYWAGRLLALWEGGLPHRMEADSLRTLGEYTFKGLLQKQTQFSAHPRVCANTGHLVNFASTRTNNKCSITVHEFAPGEIQPAKERSFDVAGFPFFHDFVVTDKYYIFNQAPTTFDPIPFLLGQKGPAECIGYDVSKPALIHLIPRDPALPVEIIEVDPHFNFHFANGFDEGPDDISIDVVRADEMVLGEASKSESPLWENLDWAKDVPYTKIERYRFTRDGPGREWQITRSPLSNQLVDFMSVAPSVSCKQHRFVYGSCGSSTKETTPLQHVIKLDLQEETETIWCCEKHEFVQEVIFFPREDAKSEDDGYLVGVLTNGEDLTSDLLLFDAQKIAEGPISRQRLPTRIPFGLHGSFAPGITFNSDDIDRRFIASKSLENKRWNEVVGGFSGLGISGETNMM
jgi:all-trans-8'-apo-beta-carotenal 15,15'-oxygenase